MEEVKQKNTSTIVAIIALIILVAAFIGVLVVVNTYKGSSMEKEYLLSDYLQIATIDLTNYNDAFDVENSSVHKFNLSNIDTSLISDITAYQDEIDNKIETIYNDVKANIPTDVTDYTPTSTLTSDMYYGMTSDGILYLAYQFNANLDFDLAVKSTAVGIAVDVPNNKILTTTEVLSKNEYQMENMGSLLFDRFIATGDMTLTVVDSITGEEMTLEQVVANKSNYLANIDSSIDTITDAILYNGQIYIIVNVSSLKALCYEVSDTEEEGTVILADDLVNFNIQG